MKKTNIASIGITPDKNSFLSRVSKHKILLLMILPTLVYFLVFS